MSIVKMSLLNEMNQKTKQIYSVPCSLELSFKVKRKALTTQSKISFYRYLLSLISVVLICNKHNVLFMISQLNIHLERRTEITEHTACHCVLSEPHIKITELNGQLPASLCARYSSALSSHRLRNKNCVVNIVGHS